MRNEMIQLLNELRGRFFQIINKIDDDICCETLVDSFLSFTKQELDLDEISFFKYDDWKQQFYIEVTTNDRNKSFVTNSDISLSSFKSDENICCFFEDHPFKEFQGYQALIPFYTNQMVWGLLAFKEKTPDTFSMANKDEWCAFFQDLSSIIQTVLYLSKVTHEEKRYKQLYRVTEKFHSSMSMDAVLGEILSTLQSVYPSFEYYLLLSHDNDNHENLPIKELVYDDENVAAMQAFVTGTVQFEEHTIEQNSVLHAPLKGKQGVYGVLQVIASNTQIFPKDEIEFITLLANTAGSALENAQLYQQSKQHVADLQLINETSRYLNMNLRVNETIAFMKKQIKKAFNAEKAGFVLVTENGDMNVLPGSSEFFDTRSCLPYLQFTQAKISEEKESLFISELSMYLPNEDLEYHSLMAVPMLRNSDISGFAVVLHKDPYYFSFDMFKVLQSLIHHSSLAMANSILREELEKLIITDHLTQLRSRNYLDEQMCASMKEDEEGTFILIDIDNFKKVNDTYGHQVGDEILIQVAKLIQKNIRETDIGARWGGEELAIYLPKVNLSIGVQIAERLKDAVAEQSNPKVTISCGVSYWSKDYGMNAKELFKRADEALYIAKNTGKNKVLVQRVN